MEDRTLRPHAMDTSLAEALDHYAATSGHRLAKEILVEHEADLFRLAPLALHSVQRHRPSSQQPHFYWLDKD
jgi:hypothetical protein